MPKPNQTMLDKLAETFKSVGKPAPFRGMKIRGEFNDPLNYTTQQRILMQGAPELSYMAVPQNGVGKDIKLTPERKIYQRGIEARLYPKKVAADEQVDEMYDNRDRIQEEWNEAVDDAKESMRDDWDSALSFQDFEDVDPYALEVDAPTTDLREYWPGYARSPEEIGEEFESAEQAYYDAKDAQKRIYSTRGIMDEQVQTPRYRNYQRAMQQREDNARLGRLNAAIMNLYRRGYSMPEIREILRNQRIR